jgi:endonuclease/exonuclease/phosphatase (EEP) superfamily protein YafD
MTLIYRSVMVLAAIAVLVVSTWSVVGIFNDDVVLFRYMNYFGYYMPIISVLALILGGVAAIRTLAKPLWAILPVSLLALPGLVLPYILATADLGGEKTALASISRADASPFTVMTFSKMSRNRNYAAIADLLDCKKYDAILIQEAPDFEALIKAHPGIAKECNTSFVGNQYKSLVLQTPHKIVTEQSSKFGNLFVIELPGSGPVALLTNRVDKTLNKSVALQRSQVERMLLATKELRDAGIPTIVAGDFNATPFNAVHYYMREEMAYARPAGIMNQTFTFPAEGRRMGMMGPQIRIDHIFYTGMQLKHADVLDTSAGSDHYPVRAEFLLPKQVIKDTE